MKVNFKKLEIQTSFEGNTTKADVTKALGNLMMYNGSVLLDIGFEELAKKIYYSTGEVEIPKEYKPAIKEVVLSSTFPASVKRTIKNLMEKKED